MSKVDELRKAAAGRSSSAASSSDKKNINFSTRSVTPAAEIQQSTSSAPRRSPINGPVEMNDIMGATAKSDHPIQDVIARGASKVANWPVIKPTLGFVGEKYNQFTNLPGVENVYGAGAGAVNTIPELLNPKINPLKAINDIATSTGHGLLNPKEAREQLQQAADRATTGAGPVEKFITKSAILGAADPLSYIPIPIGKGIGALKNTAKGAAKEIAENAIARASTIPERTLGTTTERTVSSPANVQKLRQLAEARRATETPQPRVEEHAPTPEAQVMKGNWWSNLFGDSGGLGISPFGSRKRLSEKPLTSKEAIVQKGIVNSNEGVMKSMQSGLERAHTAVVDDLSPLKMVSRDTYETAMDSRRANNLANNIIHDKFVTPEGKVVGPSMTDTFLKVARGKDKDFVDYMIQRDAIDRVSRGERVYDDSVKVYDPVKRDLVSLNDEATLRREVGKIEEKYPQFKELGNEWNGFTNNMLQHYGVDMGMLTPESKAAMQTARPNYIKTMRQFSRGEKPKGNVMTRTRRGFSGQNLPIKRATGSGRNIVDPRKTMQEAVGGFVNASMRNRAMQEVYKEVSANPEKFKGVVEVVEESADAAKKTVDEINKVIAEDGIAGLTEMFDSGYEAAFKKGSQKGNKDNVVTVMVNGNPVKLRISNPSLINAVTGMGPQATNMLTNVLGAFSRATKRGATGILAPTFITKSAVMDFPQAIMQSKNPIQQAGLSVYAVLSGIGDKLNIPGLRDLAREYRLAGGDFSPTIQGESRLNKNVMNMTRYPILSGKNIVKQGIKGVAAPFKALESVGSIVENAPRVAAAKIARKKFDNPNSPEAVRAGMSAGREATVNYLRRGHLTSQLESASPYTNAAIQGTYRIMRGFKNNPVRTIAAIGALSVLPKLHEYMQFADDPDYQNLPARERMRFLIVNKNEDGTFTKIPMDPAYNSFGELTIEALRKFKDKDPQAFKDTADALANAWTPPLVTGALQGATKGTGAEGSIVGALNSTVAAPAVAISANKSFTGAPIESADVTGNSKGERYKDTTSELAKKIGPIVGLSPLKTDYLLKAYGGDIFRIGLPANSSVGAGTTRTTLGKNFIVDPVLTNNLTNDFYAYKTALNQAYQDNLDHDKPLPKWYDDELRKEILSTSKMSLSKQIKDITAEKKVIAKDENLSAVERAKRIRELQSRINNIYVDINSKLNRQGVPTKGRE